MKPTKSDLDTVLSAVDALPEQEQALMSESGSIAYVNARDRVLKLHGWTLDAFLDRLGERVLEQHEQEQRSKGIVKWLFRQ